LVALTAAGLLAPFALAACGSSAADEDHAVSKNAPLHDMLPKELQSKDSLTVASNVEYPPFEFLDADNKTVLGIDREIADGLEKQLGIRLVFDNIAFDAIIPGLESGRYEMAMSAMTDNVERQQQVDFVDYFKAGAGVMSKTEDGDKYQTLEDICGLTAGIVKGTTEVPQAADGSKACEAAGKPAIKSVIFPGQNQAILAITNGRVDVVLMDSAPGAYAAKQATGLQMSPPYQSQPFGVVFAKGTTELQKAVQKALENMAESGEYEAALKKYGLESGAVDAFPINGATE
jgi:polar amino acid transport system substrate-binding protein